ncbi:two-component system response regulator [Desulfuribacillus stibiiarsenatis]|uniref:Two-component system response regulator n=1 Tax=Desulfuribacillus stibiiarsenatis TaxID=1390249 RepID=A0A1E5L5J9_9FIRM|nr:response regulator [Desulfuribacillus stibiiarsenatis]OEH85417.1 two-component system response regulator [Desulfuribacillus stibiiarsenatis]
MSPKVLVVDDQYGIRLLISEVLRSEGIEVKETSTGEEAIEISKDFSPDLILLDMKMPGMNGVDILRYFRKKKNLDIPIYMMTAYSELDMLAEAERLGVTRQFTKPFDIFDVSRAIVEEVCNTPVVCG